jgi:3-dehydroquinate synthetase
MVDSAVGGKTGFDTRHGKNLIGAFHQPSLVLCDVQVLSTLAPAERRAGLAEVVKSAWIDGEAAVAQLEADADALARGEQAATLRAIRMAAGLKARIVTQDEREEGLRALLNLGHTLAHAIEASSGYGGLPTEVEPYLGDRVLSFLGADKKRKGAKVSYVAPGLPGDVTLVPLTLNELTVLLRQR